MANIIRWKDIETDNALNLYTEYLSTGIVDNIELFNYFTQVNQVYGVFTIPREDMGKYFSTQNKLLMDRTYVSLRFGYPILSTMLLNQLKEICKGKKVIDVGCGSGWLCHQLQLMGVNTIGVDISIGDESPFTHSYLNIIKEDAVEYLKKNQFDIVIMSFPDYNTQFAFDILSILNSNQKLIYIGEQIGGCTGNNNFFNLLELKASLNKEDSNKLSKYNLPWICMKDNWYVYDIKDVAGY